MPPSGPSSAEGQRQTQKERDREGDTETEREREGGRESSAALSSYKDTHSMGLGSHPMTLVTFIKDLSPEAVTLETGDFNLGLWRGKSSVSNDTQ